MVDSVNVMSSMYGSHVIRSLLCLCKGVPLDSLEEFHLTKASSVLAERLNTKSYQSSNHNLNFHQQSFPILLKFLVRELLKHAKDEMPTLRANKYSSFVLQVGFRVQRFFNFSFYCQVASAKKYVIFLVEFNFTSMLAC